jgi:hypothetical protein
MGLFAGCLLALSQTAQAQETRYFKVRGGAPGGGQAGAFGGGIGFVQEFNGAGPARGVMIMLNGQDVGASLLTACDTNQDGAATITELKAALSNWFQQTDTDTNGALSEVEFSTALKTLFPVPEPPPGAPPIPEEHMLHNMFAKKIMAAVDANNDAWITSKEALAFVDQGFPTWDADNSGALDASELAAAFAQLMPAPSFSTGGGGSVGFGAGRSFKTDFDR